MTKLSGTPDDPSANWIFEFGIIADAIERIAVAGEERLKRRRGVADRNPLDFYPRLFQPYQHRRFGDARRAPAGEDVEQPRLTIAEVGACKPGLAGDDRGKRECGQRLADHRRPDGSVGRFE